MLPKSPEHVKLLASFKKPSSVLATSRAAGDSFNLSRMVEDGLYVLPRETPRIATAPFALVKERDAPEYVAD